MSRHAYTATILWFESARRGGLRLISPAHLVIVGAIVWAITLFATLSAA